MKLITKFYLGILKVSLKLLKYLYILLPYMLFNMYYNYSTGYSFFIPLGIVECAGSQEINNSLNTQLVNEIARQIQNEGLQPGLRPGC